MKNVLVCGVTLIFRICSNRNGKSNKIIFCSKMLTPAKLSSVDQLISQMILFLEFFFIILRFKCKLQSHTLTPLLTCLPGPLQRRTDRPGNKVKAIIRWSSSLNTVKYFEAIEQIFSSKRLNYFILAYLCAIRVIIKSFLKQATVKYFKGAMSIRQN